MLTLWPNTISQSTAESTNQLAIDASSSLQLQDAGVSVLRLLGAFGFVIALFFLGIWLFRNWQRGAVRRGTVSRLNILEAKSLGNRQLLFVVGYDQQRMLLGTSPGGISLLAMLPESTHCQVEVPTQPQGFPATLAGIIGRRLAR